MRRARRLSGIALGVITVIVPIGAIQGQTASHPLDELLRASARWERRSGSERRVVDQVCLVPDLATFLQVLATWDDRHYFPILLDDVELTFKFLRAFHPARIVRWPNHPRPLAANQTWAAAVAAVGHSWTDESKTGRDIPAGDAVPKGLAQSAPGLVLSSPDSPMLAGAAALAAGRFQPLVSWDVKKRFGEVLTPEESHEFALKLEALVAKRVRSYDRLGDDCDFLTLAGDWPYRYECRSDDDIDPHMRPFYRNNRGPLAFDDLLARTADRRARWAFVGRLLGDARTSVYRAMCSLFLQPESAALVNTYEATGVPWAAYAMPSAARRLERVLPVTQRSGASADLAGWHRLFDPVNRFGLLMINSHGDPSQFHVTGGTATTSDVPLSVPAAVVMIHSFSATDPTDTSMIAARWLANGAFAYFGSMKEPSLQAFRTPDLVAGLAAAGVPLAAAVREWPTEPFGQPWRLLYVGDPFYRIKPKAQGVRTRPEQWPAGANWPQYNEVAAPAASAPEDAKLTWAMRTCIAQLRVGGASKTSDAVLQVVLGIRRERLSSSFRPFFDALLTDRLIQANRPGELCDRLARIAPGERSADVRRWLETCRVMRIQQAVAARDFRRAEAVWSEVARDATPGEFFEMVTARVGALADSATRREEWLARLRAAQNRPTEPQAARIIEVERKRIEAMR